MTTEFPSIDRNKSPLREHAQTLARAAFNSLHP